MAISPPEWILYDIDLSTALGTIVPINPQVYMRLNDCGSGRMTVPKTDSLYASLAIGQFIGLNYRGTFQTGFFIDDLTYDECNSREYAGLAVNVSGRGMLSIIDDAIVWDWWTPGTDDIRYFGEKNPLTDGSAAVAKGSMLYTLLSEARDYQVNAAAQTLERYCWHQGGTAGGGTLLTWDFTAAADSSSVAWSDTDNMELRIGTSLLDVVAQIAAIQYDFKMDFDPAGVPFTLHAYDQRIGTDRSGSVLFTVGTNCINVSRRISGGEIRNAILVEFSHEFNPFTELFGSASMVTYRRRESLLQAANASDSDTALTFGTAELNIVKDPKYDITIAATDAVAPAVFTDYTLGDTIGYVDIGGGTVDYRVNGLQLSWRGDNPYANVIVEFTTG